MTSDRSPITPARYEPPAQRPPRPAATRLRAGAVVVAVALAAALFAAWFLLTARAVYIGVEPVGAAAEVEVHGGLKLNLADRYLLRAGTYRVHVTAPGYRPLDEALTVGDSPSQRYRYTLSRLPGHLRVTTKPDVSAQVYLDGEPRGAAPLVVRDVPAGEHRLRVSAERYFPYEETVTVEGLDREQAVAVALRPAWAEVTLATEPAGAEVLVDDEAVGRTPLTTDVIEGVHRLRVQRSGFKPWHDEIEVTAGQPQQFTDIALQPADAVVRLGSEPPRASVTVDGEYRGLTPLELALVPGRPTTIRLFRQGYRPASRTLTVASGEKRELQLALEPELVTVVFDVTPADAEVFIDGRSVGGAGRNVELPARPHRVAIRHEGFVDYETTLTPYSGMPQQLHVALKTLEQARLEQIKPVITTAAGQQLKLFRPAGRFTLGASRREPGRRANESLRTVQLQRPFYLGLDEVTNDAFRQFDAEHSSGTVLGSSLDGPRQPVVRVSWEQAARYCNWLSRKDSLQPFYVEEEQRIVGVNPLAEGYRLPTEAEWEWAARSVAGGAPLKFPWGPEMPPRKDSGNYADASAGGVIAVTLSGYEDGYVVSAPVGSFPAGNRGLFDIGGNVSEWVHDFYDVAIGMSGAAVDPLGPEHGEFHVIKGSSWAHGSVTELRLSWRDYAAEPREDVGFRLARYLE